MEVKGEHMKRHIKYLAFGIAALTISLLITNFCEGQSDSETVYYNNPDIISNRLQMEQDSSTKLYKNTKLVFATIEEARKILTTKDEYIKSQTAFDRMIRLHKEWSVSEEEYRDFVSEQVIEWTDSEKNKIKNIIQNIKPRLEKYDLNLPSTVFLIQTTGKEEGGAAYCRSNVIVLPQSLMNGNIQGQGLETLIVHELFHIFTRNNPATREKLYSTINFKKCKTAELPKMLLDFEIANPDIPLGRYCLELQHEGGNVTVIPMLTLENFDIKRNLPFFPYLELKLVEVENVNDQYEYKRNKYGKPVIYNEDQIPDYLNKVGENTSYLIHPEEILADNFAIMVLDKKSVKSKWVIDKMKLLLENKNKNVVGIK